MRDIKFRAWDTYNKEMLEVQELDYANSYNGQPMVRTTMYNDFFDIEDMILMQYTGLKDKNGKEIYEEDIVKATYFGKQVVGIIKYWLGCFIIENLAVSDNQIFVFDHIEVIGNIYENKNLLEEDIKE